MKINPNPQYDSFYLRNHYKSPFLSLSQRNQSEKNHNYKTTALILPSTVTVSIPSNTSQRQTIMFNAWLCIGRHHQPTRSIFTTYPPPLLQKLSIPTVESVPAAPFLTRSTSIQLQPSSLPPRPPFSLLLSNNYRDEHGVKEEQQIDEESTVCSDAETAYAL